MDKKRFQMGRRIDVVSDIYDSQNDKLLILSDVVDLLNEQQATIQRMKHSLNTIYKAFEEHYGYDMRNAVWLIDELSYDEIVDELHIAETDSKNRKEASMYWKKKCDEQQATINELQSIINHIKCEENCEDYDYCCETVCSLYNEIKHLKGENEKLRKQCFELEKDYVIETSDISDKIYLDDEIKELKQRYGVDDE